MISRDEFVAGYFKRKKIKREREIRTDMDFYAVKKEAFAGQHKFKGFNHRLIETKNFLNKKTY